ncbi:UTP--glucose-1-phosphate uridylyltransferase-like [Chrysoperla carnea]|uniref:UTP--glucose-1-phosphate uridylyltransferase-like n=1 Tax=Chrysoperla carnea TaxID=189513 RepID=UPI001D080363|nr:UTP--glucose-1-phosphate uridylyltransferase-like [Chrysoperla carnea]
MQQPVINGDEDENEQEISTSLASPPRSVGMRDISIAQNQLQQDLDELFSKSAKDKRSTKSELDGFMKLFERFLHDKESPIDWKRIQKLPNDAIMEYGALKTPNPNKIHGMLDKLVVIKLNGGLGTSMGCYGPKSVIPVRNNLTFLDLTVQQIEHINNTYNVNVPLVLMNSFNTHDDTRRVIRKYKGLRCEIYTFNQSCYPRLNRETLLPIAKTCNVFEDTDAWYPPGHGDFYISFYRSGLLKKFLEQGKTFCFLSNIDNLGAIVDLNILNLLNPISTNGPEFVMEVTDKTRADVKGGTLIQYENKLRLLEIAQVPKEHVDDFKSIKRFKFFNTNNIWAKLSAIERIMQSDKTNNGTMALNLEVIVNAKTLPNGMDVIQLETAVGAAMKSFENSIGINVPRSRFLPVKTTSDLLLVMSNLYTLSRNGTLNMSALRNFPTMTPIVKLGENHFSKVRDFLSRFESIPDLVELDHLTVSGDVTFGRRISLKGTVIIIANHGDRIDIPTGAVLENKIVSGNLRIFSH